MKKLAKNIKVEVLTGLHIGAGNDSVQIGGVDSAVIKDPRTSHPYIPGSSLKGKIRCLLETEGGYNEMDDTINKLFGATSEYLSANRNNKNYAQTATRLIFQDMFLSEEDKKRFSSGEVNTEFKTEIKIDRSKGSAKDGALRSVERVPPQTVFTGKIFIRYEDEAELKEINDILKKGVSLLNSDYLGGSGSRGYGAVKIELD